MSAELTARAFDMMQRRVERLYDSADQNQQAPASSNFSATRIGKSNLWRETRHLYLSFDITDENQLNLADSEQSRISRVHPTYSYTHPPELKYASLAECADIIRYTWTKSGDGTQKDRVFAMNTKFLFANSDTLVRSHPALKCAAVGENVTPTIDNQPATMNDVIGLFRAYTHAFEQIRLGQDTISELLGKYVLKEHLSDVSATQEAV